MCLEVETKSIRSLILVVLYRPPSAHAETSQHLYDEVQAFALSRTSDILIAGDFNINSSKEISCSNAKRVNDFTNVCFLQDLVDKKT